MIFQPSVCSSHSHVLCVSYSFLKRKNQFKNQFKLRHVFIRFYLTNLPPTALLPSNFPVLPELSHPSPPIAPIRPRQFTCFISPHPTPPTAPLHAPLALAQSTSCSPTLLHPPHSSQFTPSHPEPSHLKTFNLITSCVRLKR